MAKVQIPHQDRLKQLLHYEPDTGTLFWKVRQPSDFANNNARVCKAWNSANANKPAMTGLNHNGYPYGSLEGGPLLAHRVIWKLVHGYDPNQIDHIDGVRTNNKLANLRDVDTLTNHMNAARQGRNTSGVSGVAWRQRWPQYPGRWVVHLGKKTVGSFETYEAAVHARKMAELEAGYHKNHGRPLAARPLIRH